MALLSRRSVLAVAALAAASTLAGGAAARLVSIGTPAVSFQAIGPAGMKIDGTASQLTAAERDGKVVVTVPLTNLKTGISLRDKHLRGYLDTAHHPDATLSVERSKLKLPDDNQTVTASATGAFTLHGVTKPLAFTYRAKRTGSDYHVQALATVDIRRFGVEVPCYLGVCVKPDVKLKLHFKLRDVE